MRTLLAQSRPKLLGWDPIHVFEDSGQAYGWSRVSKVGVCQREWGASSCESPGKSLNLALNEMKALGWFKVSLQLRGGA